MRFDRRIRLFGSILFTIGMIVWMPVVIYVPALTFNQVTGIDVHLVTMVVCIICTFYTCVGGLKAVIWTDVIQSFVMFGSIFLLIVKGTIDVGGFNVVLQRNFDSGRLNAPEMTWDPTVRLSILSVIIGGTLHKLQSSSCNQICIQRFLSLPDFKKAKTTMILFTILLFLLLLACAYVGLLCYAFYYNCDPLTTKLAKATDQLVPLLVMDILGKYPGLAGLFVCGVFSAALSSLSTALNSLACVILEDFIKPNSKTPLSERSTAAILRVVVAFFGLGCIALVLVVEKLGMVLQLSTALAAITQGPMLGLFTIGACIPWINGKSALTGSVASFIVVSIIFIRGQIAQMTGELHFAKMPTSVDGCTYKFDNISIWRVTETYAPAVTEVAATTTTTTTIVGKSFHHMSFLWYTAFGAVLCIITAVLASLLFGTVDTSGMDQALVAPFMRRFMQTKRYLNVQMEDVEVIRNETKERLCPANKSKQNLCE